MALIAVSRCISLSKPDLGEKMFAGRNGKVIILLVWIYANLLMVPMYTEIDPKVRFLHFFIFSRIFDKSDEWSKRDVIKISQIFGPKIHSPPINFKFKCVFGIF